MSTPAKAASLVLITVALAGCHRGNLRVPYGALVTEGSYIDAEDGAWRLTAGQRFPTPYSSECSQSPTPDNYGECDEEGGRRVRVKVPQLEQPLYGVLCLCKILPDYQGPVSRQYQIEIPPKYVTDTAGGVMSVIYEDYTVPEAGTFKGWILWLSREPIPGGDPNAVRPAPRPAPARVAAPPPAGAPPPTPPPTPPPPVQPLRPEDLAPMPTPTPSQ